MFFEVCVFPLLNFPVYNNLEESRGFTCFDGQIDVLHACTPIRLRCFLLSRNVKIVFALLWCTLSAHFDCFHAITSNLIVKSTSGNTFVTFDLILFHKLCLLLKTLK